MAYGHRQVCIDRGGLMSLVSDLGDVRWLIYVLGLLTTAVCLGGGLILVRDKDTKVKED